MQLVEFFPAVEIPFLYSGSLLGSSGTMSITLYVLTEAEMGPLRLKVLQDVGFRSEQFPTFAMRLLVRVLVMAPCARQFDLC
jgi:hypothetical protein